MSIAGITEPLDSDDIIECRICHIIHSSTVPATKCIEAKEIRLRIASMPVIQPTGAPQMSQEHAEEMVNALHGVSGGAIREVAITEKIVAKVLTPNPPDSNPFHHDFSNMGTVIAKNITVMHHTHESQVADYIIVVNTATGERIRLSFKKD